MDAFKQLELANVKVYKNAKETGLLLGMGSFGSVVELTIKGEGKFAGKKIHEVLIIDGDASILVKECKLMSELSHPNIAKFCGVCRLPSRSAPVLVMELMDNSLEDFLENKAFHLALTTAISILMDIANGLAYLHGRTPRVLHRDLTARNVLLDRYTNAKITDFGNSRIIDVVTRVGKTMTQAPGTSVYMPPEALDSHSTYSDRLDVFSFGHLALYALMRQFPKDLLPATYITPKGDVVARTELDRRSKYMDCLSVKLPEQDHQLYQLVEQCLQNDPTKRPDACKLLAILQKSLCLQYGDLYTKTAPEPVENAASKSSDESQLKTGLIEKKSRVLSKFSERGAWRAHTFTVDYKSGTFQYTRQGSFPARGPTIRLDDIKEIQQLEQDGPRFPFEVHHRGKHSPWKLRVYSEADRKAWKERLEMHQDVIKQPVEKEVEKENAIEECIYDKIIDILKEQFNPSEIDVLTKKLQTSAQPTPGNDSTVPEPQNAATAVVPTVGEQKLLPVDSSPPLPPRPAKVIAMQKKHLLTLETHEPFPHSVRGSSVGDFQPPRLKPHIPKSSRTLPAATPAEFPKDDYEDLEYERMSTLEVHTWTPPTPSLPPRRSSSPCASLEALQKEALSISPSSLSNATKIGEGQFGDVYKAEMNAFTVAVKVIKKYSSKRVRDQFENEMSIMSQVSHNNIVRLHGIIREGSLSPALVMEFLPNGDLKSFLKREPQPHEFLMKCMTDIAMGMHYLCERGLIHRDLAARNVLLDENRACKVSDFGLLREVPKDKSVYVSRGDGRSPLRWMAPESITDNIFSAASDVWSYGILQWEMFFPGKPPYPEMQTAKMIVKVASGYRMPTPRGCPPLVAKIMRACWQHYPNERPTFLLISNLLNSRDRLSLVQ